MTRENNPFDTIAHNMFVETQYYSVDIKILSSHFPPPLLHNNYTLSDPQYMYIYCSGENDPGLPGREVTVSVHP